MVNGEHYTDKTAETAIHNLNIKEYREIEELKKWLNRGYKLHKKLECNQEKIQRLRSTRIIAMYGNVIPGGGGSGDKIGDALVKQEELIIQQKIIIKDLIEVRNEIMDEIKIIENKESRKILIYRHMQYLSFRKIAKNEKIGKSTICRKYKKALHCILTVGH